MGAASGGKYSLVRLKPDVKADEVVEFERGLSRRIIGQSKAVEALVRVYQSYISDILPVSRPAGIFLFAGPTGVGKTRAAEAMAEILHGSPQALTKVNCGEFQHSHEIAKLLGSPPGYLGHRETRAMLTQDVIDKYNTENCKLSIVLFDEIEKANDALWNLLLGVTDKGKITLGDNTQTDFTKSAIIMTTNSGAREMADSGKGIGFKHTTDVSNIGKIADTAVRRKFTPEFINRLDAIITFDPLTEEDAKRIFDLEISRIQARIYVTNTHFILTCTPEAKMTIIQRGVSKEYGARELKRVMEREIVTPLANITATNQVHNGDTIQIALEDGKLIFEKFTSLK